MNTMSLKDAIRMQETLGNNAEFDAFGDIDQIPYGERFPCDDYHNGFRPAEEVMPSGVFIDGRELSVAELAEYEETLRHRDYEQTDDDDIRDEVYYESMDDEWKNDRLGVDTYDDDNYGGFRRIIKDKRDFV